MVGQSQEGDADSATGDIQLDGTKGETAADADTASGEDAALDAAADATGADLAADATTACAIGSACPCQQDGDCQTGKCLIDPKTGAGTCALPCENGACKDGLECKEAPAPGGGTLQLCLPKAGCQPKPESCNGIDDNCDGKTDEGFCYDGNACTDDFCDISGTCNHPANNAPCDDGNACSAGDACKDGQCNPGGASVCDDSNACTKDSCDAKSGNCTHEPVVGGCEDGNACTLGDQCGPAGCQSGKPLQCDDANPCSDDSCDPKTGCANLPNTATCSDGDGCTAGDLCSKGVCVAGAPNLCDDGSACTADSCKNGACVNLPVAATCDDNNLCTEADLCKDGACFGTNKDCDDGSPCTIDVCATGVCQHKLVPEFTACDDKNPCTESDFCDHDGMCKGSDKNCDDNNPCTLDKCQKSDGQCKHEPTQGQPCEDGNACTLGDACLNGQCASGGLKACSDSNVCTADSCDVATALCLFAPITGTCNDNNPCTLTDTCDKGQCAPGAAKACDDGNPCTVEACDPANGQCAVKNSVAGIACDDGQACLQGESCLDGKCQPGKPIACDDGNPCTNDACDDATGKCKFVNADGKACDDGNPCTDKDACGAGKCVSGKMVCECQSNADCAAKDDADLCNGTLFCELKSHNCLVDPKTIVNCDGSKNTACLTITCNAKNGKCEPSNAPDQKPCDADSSVCTQGDSCLKGLCTAGPLSGCDDGNPCTNDACDPTTGCSATNNKATCDDNNPCTTVDACANGKCVGNQPKNCDDGNPCTADTCDVKSGLCNSKALTGDGCSDNNACTTGDLCNNGVCQAAGKVNCDDGKTCTVDTCDPLTGKCSNGNAPNGLQCEDGNACTVGDACLSGGCNPGKYSVCSDGSPCTSDGCDVKTGKCVFTPSNDGGACSDGDECTVGDKCLGGSCQSGAPKACTDVNPCVLPKCDNTTGKCVAKPGNLPCDDGNACSNGDACNNGVCAPANFTVCSDGTLCTDDSCDTKTGKCVFANNSNLCDDGNACTGGDKCANAACAGSPVNCNDSNICTADACDPKTGCTHAATNEGGGCSDGNACTGPDACAGGGCKGAGVTCNDGNPCTTDTCDPKTGCKFAQNTGACNDGNPCTVGDSCTTGKCVSGPVSLCTDNNACTDDACNPATGDCKFTNDDTNACSDNNACTTGDTCAGGLCKPGSGVKQCDDGNPCTGDWCDPATGCVAAPNPAVPCDDGNSCTTKDICIGGKCLSGTIDLCDDANACTIDSCDTLKGCQHANANVPCDDGDACMGPDACSNGKCVGAAAVVCNDKNTCTTDTCDAKAGCVYAPVSGGGSKTDVFVSDGNTQVSDTKAPNGGPFPQFINFKPAVPTYVAPNWKANVPGATWIWVTPKVTDPTLDHDTEFRFTFNVTDPGKVLATLTAAADNTLICWVNTKLAFSDLGSDNFSKEKVANVTAGLKVGTNMLRCEVSNLGVPDSSPESNPAGLAFRLEILTLVQGAPCDDGNACTTVDVCYGGNCTGVVGQTCDDGNACTVDTCGAQGCVNTAKDGLPCDDGSPCTGGDACNGGKCLPGGIVSCDDGNACTNDACNGLLGCTHKPASTGIFTAITVPSDSKTAVVTANGSVPATATWDQFPGWTHAITGATWLWSSAQVIDATATTTTVFQRTFDIQPGFETLVGTVTLAADGAMVCKLNGKLVAVETAENSYATPTKISLNGKMVAGANVWNCTITNPGKANATPTTNPAGLLYRIDIQWYAVGGASPCQDGNACTAGDWCSGAYCQPGAGVDCDDNDACTTDFCDNKTGCAHKSSGALACDDGNPCTVNDACVSGKCAGGKATDCNDNNACTADSCDPKTGCVNAISNGAKCDDGNPCTTSDSCKDGKCTVSQPTVCNDSNACTADLCSTQQGCYYSLTNGAACDDGNVCTVNDTCAGGSCLGVAQNACNDNNACTKDACDPVAGCSNTAVASGPCDDGNACTVDDGCKGDKCVSGTTKQCNDGNPCTVDTCDAKTALCTFVSMADGSQCEDGNPCTTSDKCAKTVCVGGPPRDCSDGNPCTDDACNPQTGDCSNLILVGTYACDDGDPCSLNDLCKNGVCAGTAKVCDDKNPCTADSCNSGTGLCFYKAIGGCQP